jgi:hypothetical protein
LEIASRGSQTFVCAACHANVMSPANHRAFLFPRCTPMHPSNFECLVSRFCELAHARMPRLGALQEDGSLCYWLVCSDVPMQLRHEPLRHPRHVLLRAVFAGAPELLDAASLRELLHTNWLMHEPGAPAFALDPSTGEAVLQYTLALEEIDAAILLRGVDTLAETVRRFRECGAAQHGSARSLAPHAGVFA